MLNFLCSLLPVARKSHRGPRTTNKKSTILKTSAQRREQLFSNDIDPFTSITHQLPSERSKDVRTAQEKLDLIDWVGTVFYSKAPEDDKLTVWVRPSRLLLEMCMLSLRIGHMHPVER